MGFDRLVVLVSCVAWIVASPDAAAAQVTRDASPALAAAGRPGAEVAVFAGLLLVVPTVGGTVSMPVGRGYAVEGGGSVMAFASRDGTRQVAAHLQLRIPQRRTPGGAWKSLLVGVATFPELDDFLAGGETRTRIRPHAASAWHWLGPRGNGVRLDVGVLADFRRPVPLPYVKAAAIVPIGRRQRMESGR